MKRKRKLALTHLRKVTHELAAQSKFLECREVGGVTKAAWEPQT